MEDKYSDKKNKVLIVIGILYVAAIVGVNIYHYKSMTENYNYELSAIDGIVSFLIDNRNLIGTETMLLSFLLFYVITPNLNNEYLCLYKNRQIIYHKQIKQAFLINCIGTLANAVISFTTMLVFSRGLLNWKSVDSIYFRIFKENFQPDFLRLELYMLLSVAASIVIVQIYLMFYLLIYWIIKSRNFTFIVGIVMSWSLGRPIVSAKYKLTNNMYDAVHLLMREPVRILNGLLKYGTVALIIYLCTRVVLRKRDLL